MANYNGKFYDPDNICQDDHEWLTGTGAYTTSPQAATIPNKPIFVDCDNCGQPVMVQETQEGGDLGWTRYSYQCPCGHAEADISIEQSIRGHS
jgi:hypothetical protein